MLKTLWFLLGLLSGLAADIIWVYVIVPPFIINPDTIPKLRFAPGLVLEPYTGLLVYEGAIIVCCLIAIHRNWLRRPKAAALYGVIVGIFVYHLDLIRI